MEEQNNVNVEEKKVEETKEVQTTYKKHGPLYWLIIIVGMTFIVFMSVRMGEKIAEEKIEKEDGSKPSTVTSNSNSNVESNSNTNTTDEEAIKKSIYEKMTLLFPDANGNNLSKEASTATANLFEGKFADSDKITFAIHAVDGNKVQDYKYTNGKFTNKNIETEVLEEVKGASQNNEKLDAIPAEAMAEKYRKIFGTEPNYTDSTMECPVFYYDSLNKMYIPISRCGGVGGSKEILYIDSYNITGDDVVVTTYVGGLTYGYETNTIIYSEPVTSNLPEKKFTEIKENEEFKIDDTNKTSFAKYNFTFTKAADGEYYFKSLTKAN